MIDLDKKVGNRVCANTKGGSDVVSLDKVEPAQCPYLISIRTGCKNEPRRGDRFCKKCMSEFAVTSKGEESICFLQSLHPLGGRNKKHESSITKLGDSKKPGYILVKQFGVTYKY